jgi:hypothetical protein
MFHEINHPFFGVPPFMETPKYGSVCKLRGKKMEDLLASTG